MRHFTLPATPANARRMCEAARITNLDVAPEIAALAGTGLITPEEFAQCPFNVDESVREMTQTLVDYDANAIVRFDDRDIDFILNGVVASMHLLQLPAVVVTGRKDRWPKPPNTEFHPIGTQFAPDYLTRERRKGVLVLDRELDNCCNYRDFQHIIDLCGITTSLFRSTYLEKDFLATAVAALFGPTPFTITDRSGDRRGERGHYPYFNIIDLLPDHK